MQGGIHPDLPGTFYFDLVEAVRRRVPDMHVHAFSPMEVLNGATKLGVSYAEFLSEAKARGLGTIPGTAAEILDDEVRWVLTKGKLPADAWEEIVRTAHGLGIRSSSTIMFGHVDAPPHWVAHLRRLASDPGRHRRLHGVRPAAVRAPERADLPRGQGPPRRHVRGEPPDARGRPHPPRRTDPEHPGVLGQARRRHVPGDPASGRQRLRRHADGGDDQPDGRGGVGDRDDAGSFDEAIVEIGRTPAVRTTTYGRVGARTS